MPTDDAPLKIGILGAARIAPPAVVAPCRATGVAEVVAVAARDRGRAEAFAAEHGVGIVADDYQALIEHPQVEAVYVALPPSRHKEMALAALAAGKPVLCEKPFAMSGEEAWEMTRAADAAGLVLMEAFHYRYHPLFERLLEIVRSGEIGPVRRIEAIFRTSIAATPGELRYDPDLGGGALMDLGTYCVHWCRSVAAGEPKVIRASAMRGETGVDISTHADLAFPGGISARIACDMASDPHATLEVEGLDGRLKVVNPLAPQLGYLMEVHGPGGSRRETVGRDPTYDFQLRAFVAAARGGPVPPTCGADSVAQMAALDAIRAASRS